ncbi:2-phospho-L-lactate guanylyltransferase [Nocardioides sp.]|uniref:2-phospho-L-lactate guanylyltransferase n=1 Tax=Nocardioides sp. TaxID=35761 RepID=UPI00351955A5
MSAGGWVVLLPVKSPQQGKSRLGAIADDDRALLADAFARDTVRACEEAASVRALVIVSDDLDFAATLSDAASTLLCADPGDGLNAALRAAAALARAHHPQRRAVALLADLPALRGEHLDVVLGALAADGPEGTERAEGAEGTAHVVIDADGTGTTLYTAGWDAFDPRFGAGSAARHRAAGARDLTSVPAALRRDVDDAASLADAIALGVGEATARALRTIAERS